MPFDAPAPRALRARLAEGRDAVAVRIADVAPLASEQNLIEEHEAARLIDALAAPRRRQQPVRESALAARQLAIRQPLPIHRGEMPVEALVVVERERCLFPLRVVERGEKMLGLRLHLSRDILERRAPRGSQPQGSASEQYDSGSHRTPPRSRPFVPLRQAAPARRLIPRT